MTRVLEVLPETGGLSLSPAKSAPRRASIVETHEGSTIDSIAKGMFSNQSLSMQKKGTKIAGRVLGQAKACKKEKS